MKKSPLRVIAITSETLAAADTASMEQIYNATPERLQARWRRPLRGWTTARSVAVRPSAAALHDAPLRTASAADETPPFDEQDLLRRLREAGL